MFAHAERRRALVVFFAVFFAVSLTGFLPSIGISISFCPADALRVHATTRSDGGRKCRSARRRK